MSDGIRLELLAAAEVTALRTEVLERLGARAAAVTAALDRAPAGWTLHGRAAEPVPFGGGTLLIAGGPAASTLDRFDADLRMLQAADVAAFCRLADALPQVSVVAPPCFTPPGVVAPGEGSDGGGRPAASACAAATGSPAAATGPLRTAGGSLPAAATALAATGKHLLLSARGVVEAQAIVDMALAVAGGRDALRERPPLSMWVWPGDKTADMVRLAAEAGVPAFLPVVPTGGGRTALIEALSAGLKTTAGAQNVAPGAPVALSLLADRDGPLDVAGFAAAAAACQLAHSFGLPLAATTLSCSAATPDWLASAENTTAALTAWLAGADGLAGAGLLRGGSVTSLVQLALDAEIASYVAATVAGVRVDDESLAVDVIEKVGIGGNYLGEKHTRRTMRHVWRPRFFDRVPCEQWIREGRRQSAELAAEFVERTLADHHVPPLAPALVAELERIVRRAAAS